jgi:hypothetical protein
MNTQFQDGEGLGAAAVHDSSTDGVPTSVSETPAFALQEVFSAPIHGISCLSRQMSRFSDRLCWFSRTNLIAAFSKLRSGLTP